MKKLKSINKKERLYVFNEEGHVSCLGFDNLHEKGKALAAELGEEWMEKRGTKTAVEKYNLLIESAREKNEKTGWRSDSELSPQLIGLEGQRVEVETTYGENRRFNVGKSTGFIPCHLEVFRSNCIDGVAAEKEYKSVRVLKEGKRYA